MNPVTELHVASDFISSGMALLSKLRYSPECPKGIAHIVHDAMFDATEALNAINDALAALEV